MSDGRKYYCICDSNCRFETMTKEQILTAIAQAVADGKVSNADAGFITKVKETNAGNYVTFWVGSQAEYNALGKIENNCLYIINNDTTRDDLNKMCADVAKLKENMNSTAAYIESFGGTNNDRYQMIKFSNGFGELIMSVKIENVPLTTAFGPFFTWGASKRLSFGGINAKPEVCMVYVDGVQVKDSEGNLVKGPEAFAMVSGDSEYNSETGVAYTPHLVIAANGKAEKATVHLTYHVRWRWK